MIAISICNNNKYFIVRRNYYNNNKNKGNHKGESQAIILIGGKFGFRRKGYGTSKDREDHKVGINKINNTLQTKKH